MRKCLVELVEVEALGCAIESEKRFLSRLVMISSDSYVFDRTSGVITLNDRNAGAGSLFRDFREPYSHLVRVRQPKNAFSRSYSKRPIHLDLRSQSYSIRVPKSLLSLLSATQSPDKTSMGSTADTHHDKQHPSSSKKTRRTCCNIPSRGLDEERSNEPRGLKTCSIPSSRCLGPRGLCQRGMR